MDAGFTSLKCLSRKASQSCMVSQPNTSVLGQDSPHPVSDCLQFTNTVMCGDDRGWIHVRAVVLEPFLAVSGSGAGDRSICKAASICSECSLFETLGMGGHKWLARPVSTLQLHLLDITHEVMASWKMRPSFLRHTPYLVLPEDPTMVTSGYKSVVAMVMIFLHGI